MDPPPPLPEQSLNNTVSYLRDAPYAATKHLSVTCIEDAGDHYYHALGTTQPPSVTTGAASNLTPDFAILNGNLTGMGTAITANVFFEYGTSVSYGASTIPQSKTTAGSFWAYLTRLLPATAYHYRAVADGGASGITRGTDATFTTLPSTAPSVATRPASNVTASAATLNGNLTSLGAATAVNVSFDYGQTTDYGISTIPQTVTSTGACSAYITGLTPSSTYHFRIKADGGTAGTGYGDDVTFTTLTGATVAINNGQAINLSPNGSRSNIPIAIKNIPNLGAGNGIGAFIFTLSWSKDDIRVDSVTAASVANWTITPSALDNTNGTALITGSVSGGSAYLTSDTVVGSFNITAVRPSVLNPNISSFKVNVQNLADKNGVLVYSMAVSVQVAILPTVAETALAQGVDPGDVAVVQVKINRGKNPVDGSTATIPGGVRSFSATASSTTPIATRQTGLTGMEFVGVREAVPYLGPTFDAATGTFGVSNVASPEQPNNSTVAKLQMRLTGDCDTTYTLNVAFSQIIAATSGNNINEDSAKTLSFRRGDARADGVVNIFDAMYIAQYIVGYRPITDLNAMNAACVKHDVGGDKLDIFDAMYIAQYVVGNRNNGFEDNTQISAWGPGMLGLAVSPDGKKAYVSFAYDDPVVVADLASFTSACSINVSAAGAMLQSGSTVLTPDGRKLYVANSIPRNVMAISTENRRVVKVLPPMNPVLAAIAMSRDGSKAYVTSDDGGLYSINTADDSYQQILVPGVFFGPVTASARNPDILYAVGALTTPQGARQSAFFVFNTASRMVVRYSSLSEQVIPSSDVARRLVINQDETLAYFNWFNANWSDRGVGTFNVFDLGAFQIRASASIENGVSDFAVNEGTGKAYLIGFWAGGGAPNVLPIREWDMATNTVVRNIPVESSDPRSIAVDPANPDYLYMTEADRSILIRVQISTGREVNRLSFSPATIRPYAIIRGDNNTGYIVGQQSRRVYRLDLQTGQLAGSFESPYLNAPWGFYQGRLYVTSGNEILALNPTDGSIAARYNIGQNLRAIFLTFFGDRMAVIVYESAMIGKRLLLFDARTLTLLKSIELPLEPHGDKVIASPDGSKLYLARGLCMGGTTTISILNAATFDVLNTIQIPPVTLRRGATGFVEGDFDETNRILYLTGFVSVYKIHMDTDQLIGILDVVDVYQSRGSNGWAPTGLAGVTLSSSKDKLFVVSGDAHSMYTYDLARSAWASKIAIIKGYFITDAVLSPDRRYLYTVNNRSDSIAMIDLASGDVVTVIPL